MDTRETDTWFAAPTELSGAIGMSRDEGWDNSDEWTFTIQEDRFYEITLQSDDGLLAGFGTNGVRSGCWAGNYDNTPIPDPEDLETTNISGYVFHNTGSGEYTLNYNRGPANSCNYDSLGFLDSQSEATPGEDLFFSIINQPWVNPSSIKLDLVDLVEMMLVPC